MQCASVGLMCRENISSLHKLPFHEIALLIEIPNKAVVCRPLKSMLP